MRRYVGFVRSSFSHGWKWFVRVGNHVGAVFLVLASAGFGYLSWTNRNWWLVVLFVLGVAFVCFTVGAYQQWRTADREIGEILLPSFDATLQQLRGERGRANGWLGTLKGNPTDDEISSIEFVFDPFWLQTVEQLIKPRNARAWAAFSNPDHAAGEIEPPPADARERVFRRVRDAVVRLDAVISEYEDLQRQIKKALER